MIKTDVVTRPLDDLIQLALGASPYVSRCKLRFETHEGRVILRGAVDSFFKKQMAQESLRNVEGVDEIENLLEVVS